MKVRRKDGAEKESKRQKKNETDQPRRSWRDCNEDLREKSPTEEDAQNRGRWKTLARNGDPS